MCWVVGGVENMKFKNRHSKNSALFLGLVAVLAVCVSCKKEMPSESGSSGVLPNNPKKGPALIVSPHERPYWFTFSSMKDTPARVLSLVSSPEGSEAPPLVPWPSAVRITEIGGALFEGTPSAGSAAEGLPEEGAALSHKKDAQEVLFCPLNTWGIILFQQEVQGDRLWIFPLPLSFESKTGPFTIGPLFPLYGHMAFSVYRDIFFQELSSSPLPSTLWYYDEVGSEFQPLSLEGLVPNMQEFPSSCEIESVSPGNDGRWYVRALAPNASNTAGTLSRGTTASSQNKGDTEKNPQASPIGRLYFSLEQPGKGRAHPVSVGVYYEKTRPHNSDQLSPLLRQVVQALPYRPKGILRLFRETPRSSGSYYLAVSETSLDEADTYYWGYEGANRAIIIDSQGRGAMGLMGKEKNLASSFVVKEITLPPLPSSFVYTGVGLLKNWILASWEEQDAYLVGAAGILLLWYNE
ncbi:hypothetical protein C5O22_01075 [Treponema sp. J25]|nr:hypothetical protein C5O22_01075 [Treponema sp. J25]